MLFRSCGLCSRRGAEEAILAGKVRVDGKVVTELATQVDPGRSLVEVAGVPAAPARAVTFLFNKPKGVLCTNARDEKRPRVIDYFPAREGQRLFCVGRLDEESEGLILVTNDGELSQLIAHPRSRVPRTYSVAVRGEVSGEALEKAKGGIWLAEGRTGRIKILVRRRTRSETSMLVTIAEGRNREVRRIFARVGFPVLRLKRVRIGPLTIHKLKPGAWRPLTPAEVASLREAARSPAPDRKGPWRNRS